MYVYAIATYFFRTDFSALTFQRFDHTGASFESREYWQCSVAHMFWNSWQSSLKKKKTFLGAGPFSFKPIGCSRLTYIPITFLSSAEHCQSRTARWTARVHPSSLPMRVLADGGVWAVDCDGMIAVWPLGMYRRTLQSHSFHRQSTFNHAQPRERHMWLECTSAESNQ